MYAHLVVGMYLHETQPTSNYQEVEEKHDKEKLHQRVLVSIEEAKAVQLRISSRF